MERPLPPLAAALLLLGAACAPRGPAAWRIERTLLVPPGSPRPVALRTRGDCPASETIVVRRRGARVTLAVKGGELSRQPAGWLADWAWRAEEGGCVAPGEWPALAERVLNSTPLPLAARYRLLHPDHARSGFVDLGEANRLEVIVPILREGADPAAALAGEPLVAAGQSAGTLTVELKASPDLLGVETSWYALRGGALEPAGPPPRRILFAGVRARYWRLVYKADQSSVLVAADSRRELEAADSGDCAHCLAVPRSVAVNPYLAVMVNGGEVRVPVGSTLRGVIQAAGKKPDEVLATLALAKRFGTRLLSVEFERTKPDVLGLVMEGNETVRW